ncbi:hypothetical protein K493DRAFT_412520 [Basidiobolus meristosporus CBS 931.73]|uniref:Uncharacterized protein n=1 Tax=Basidiobolus meristosporus CBS 931.73 TaxID=1314790 RepID=A0A1Y1WU25_9FUNG|nr:hypothetical protein K493DRAFT_412520 [Basidiobolus meristosporus CBS 931.73]|eukprot:ORX77039.1 hypothetical protein K493DRAFT_412520 [Basidiobolus meristosporus CBS 931.73]
MMCGWDAFGRPIILGRSHMSVSSDDPDLDEADGGELMRDLTCLTNVFSEQGRVYLNRSYGRPLAPASSSAESVATEAGLVKKVGERDETF